METNSQTLAQMNEVRMNDRVNRDMKTVSKAKGPENRQELVQRLRYGQVSNCSELTVKWHYMLYLYADC